MNCPKPKSFEDHFETDETWGLGTMKNSAGTIQWNPHNLLKSSEDFSSSDWYKADTTVTSNAATAPDGTLTADKFSHTSTSAVMSQYATAIVGVDYVQAALFKYVDHQWVMVRLDGTNIWIDIQNGVVGTDNVGNAELTGLSDGWFLFTASKAAGDTSFNNVYSLVASDGSTTETSGTSAYIWGAHLYRNDLGGMAKVPESDRALSALEYYVPNKAVVTGPNLVSNGTFDADSGWTKGTGWTIGSGVASCDGTQTDSNQSVNQDTDMVVGLTYKVTYTVSNYSAGQVRARAGAGANGAYVSANGTYVEHLTCATNTILYLQGDSAFAGDIDNITVEEVDRNPSAARYLPRRENHEYVNGSWVKGLLVEPDGATNLIPYSTVNSTNWTPTRASITDNAAVAPDGTTTAAKGVEDSTASATHRIDYALTLTDAADYSWSVYAKAAERSSIAMQIGSGSIGTDYARFDLSAGTVAAEVGTALGYIEDAGNGWYRCTVVAAAGTTDRVLIGIWDGATQSYTGDGSSGVYLWGGQIETGLMSTSLIPTSGSAVSRGAETTTIPASVMDSLGLFNTVAVDGTELVTNGTFDSDVSGWTATDCTLAAVSGELEVTYSAATQWVDQQLSGLTAGNVYELSFSVRSDDITSGLNATVGTSQFDTSVLNISLSPTTSSVSYTYVFVAGSTSDYVSFFSSMSSGQKYYVDNISVKEIHRRAIGVQMHGYMTYADTGTFAEVRPFQWVLDGSNFLDVTLSTSGANTGQVWHRQTALGTPDNVTSSATTYSSGINVPFKIASRHLDNSLQGAADGTATTENTTPPGLPDLSGVDLEVAYSGPAMHITKLNIFAENIKASDGTFKMNQTFLERASV